MKLIANLLLLSLVNSQRLFEPIIKYQTSNINLNEKNYVGLRQSVSDSSVGKTIKSFTELTNENDHITNYYLFLDTPGGSVIAGNHLIDYLNYLNQTGIIVNCIAKTAISMGFAILQACPGERLALPSAVLMQHQMSTRMMGNILNIEKDYLYSKMLYDKMLIKQSQRIEMDTNEFFEKTRDDWWLDGESSLQYNIVDKLVNVGCSSKLLKDKEIILIETFFGSQKKKVSKCPII